eukprot:1740968-Rhodomonas_salina.1
MDTRVFCALPSWSSPSVITCAKFCYYQEFFRPKTKFEIECGVGTRVQHPKNSSTCPLIISATESTYIEQPEGGLENFLPHRKCVALRREHVSSGRARKSVKTQGPSP